MGKRNLLGYFLKWGRFGKKKKKKEGAPTKGPKNFFGPQKFWGGIFEIKKKFYYFSWGGGDLNPKGDFWGEKKNFSHKKKRFFFNF